MRTLIFMAALVICSLAISKAGNEEVIIGEKVTIKSKVLNEDRSIMVYLPQSYSISEKSYPVMYLLDGGFHFHHVSGIVEYLSTRGMMPEMIVVGVLNVDRTRDFSPTHVDKAPTSGGAEKFKTFLSDELMPYVSKNYRTEGYEVLVGHSFGGAFATYAFLTDPDVFDAYIAISPYLIYDNGAIIKDVETDLKSKYKNNKHFYMTLGDEPDYVASLDKFESIIKNKAPQNLDFTYVQMKDEDHNSIPHLSIYNGLEDIYSGWQLPKEKIKGGLAEIDGHYKRLSDKYGYEIVAPEQTINLLGYNYLNKKEDKRAIRTFEENVKRYSASANVYDSLGEAYEKDGQLTNAEKNYSKAVEIGKTQDHPYLKVYEDNLKRVQKDLTIK